MRICGFDGCERKHLALGFCKPHYRQLKKGNKLVPVEEILPGSRREKNGNWVGGETITSSGYRSIIIEPDDPMFDMAWKHKRSSHYVLEHRLVMARHLNRPLTRKETVHHINGDRLDNRIENLQLRKGKHGNGQAFMCGDCGSHNIVPEELK